MPLHLHHSNAVESLVTELARQLHAHWPADPFEPVGIVVGSRGMERWLRHQLATHHGVATRLDFPFPRQAFDGAAALLFGTTQRADFWNLRADAQRRWQVDALGFALITLLRQFLSHADFAAVHRYLGEVPGEAVSPRELTFARQVAETLDRLMHERGSEATLWQADPERAPPQHRWLARLLHALESPEAPSPAQQLANLQRLRPLATGRRFHIFGLSTMGPGDVQRLDNIARSLNVHVYALAPSHVWWADVRTHAELRLALRRATNDTQRRQIEADLASQNPVLAALGGPSRDLQVQLEDIGYLEDEGVSRHVPSAGTLLGRLQAWIADAAPMPQAGPWPVQPADISFATHAAFGPTRQVEALRDQLLSLFAADPQLEPRHVIVMTPDIETYAPLVAAIFARRGLAVAVDSASSDHAPLLPAIPTAIADLGLRQTNALAEVLLQLLALAGERVTAAALLELLTLQPVRDKLEVQAEDLADIREMMATSGMRWAFDATDRHRHAEQPELDQNTIRFGLERLALGVLMPDPSDTLDVVAGMPMPLVPEPVAGRERIARLGKLIAFVREVQHQCVALEPARQAGTWSRDLIAALDRLTITTPAQAWLRTGVVDILHGLAQDAAHLDLPLSRTALLRWLQGRLDLPQKGDRAVASAVTVCALEPMRSVPFRVVALLGMDDGKFPRGTQAPGWDPFADGRRTGERDRREIDRHLLLEALLSARSHFWLFWSGRDVRTGKRLPAAVPVEELLETLGRLTGRTRDALVTAHPLQPWSPQEFRDDKPRGFDHGLLTAARTLDALRRGELEPRSAGLLARNDATLAPEPEQQMRISLDELANGLIAPQKLLLRTRMQLTLADEDATLETREPLELDSLRGWAERDRLLGTLLQQEREDGSLLTRAFAHAAGRGALPLQAGGRALLAEELAAAQRAVRRVHEIDGEAIDQPRVSLVLADGTTLSGDLAQVFGRDDHLLLHWVTASKQPNEKLQLRAWLALLAAQAAGLAVAAARVVGVDENDRKAERWFVAPPPEEARRLLSDLVAIWRAGRCQPLPLFARTSPALADVLLKDAVAPAASLQRVLAENWVGDDHASGDGDDPAILRLFGDEAPADLAHPAGPLSLRGLAERVWLPMLAHAVAPDAPEVASWLLPSPEGA